MSFMRVDGGSSATPAPALVSQSTHPGTVAAFDDLLLNAVKSSVGLLNVFGNLTSSKDVALKEKLVQAVSGGTLADRIEAAVLEAQLWTDEANLLDQRAAQAQQKADAAKAQYGDSSQQYLKAQADANVARDEAQLAHAEAQKAAQQAQVYGNDPNNASAVDTANGRLNEVGLRVPPRNGAAADAQKQLDLTNSVTIPQLTAALQHDQNAAKAFGQLPVNYDPNAPFRETPILSAQGSNVDGAGAIKQQKVTYDQQKSLYSQGINELTQGNKTLADLDVQWLQGQLKIAKPGTPEYAALQKSLTAALAQQTALTKASQYSQARYDVDSSQLAVDQIALQQQRIGQPLINNLAQNPNTSYLFDPDGFTNPNGEYSGRLQSVSIIAGKDGQLYAHIVWEKKSHDVQLTFKPGQEPGVWNNAQQRQADAAWANVSSTPINSSTVCVGGANVSDAAQQRLVSAQEALNGLKGQDAQQQLTLAQQAYQTSMQGGGVPLGPYAAGHEPGAPGGPTVPPAVSQAWANYDAARQNYQQTQVNGAWLAFLHTQDLSNLADPDTQASLKKRFFQQNPAYRQMLFNQTAQIYGQPISIQTLNTDAKLDNAVGAALNLQPSNASGDASQPWYSGDTLDAITPAADKIRDLAGANGTVQVMPVTLATKDGELMRTALFVVTDGSGQQHIVDNTGRDYKNVKDYQNNNLLPKAGTLYMPQNLSYTSDSQGNIQVGQIDIAGQDTGWHKADNTVGIITGIATVLSFVPVVDVVAIPVALVGGGYFAARGVNHLEDMSSHGQSLWSEEGVLTMAQVGASVLPEGAALGRAAGLFRTARALDVTAIGVGAPLMAVSGYNTLNQWDSLSGADKLSSGLGLASGVFATGMGFRGVRAIDSSAPAMTPGEGISTPTGGRDPLAPYSVPQGAAPAEPPSYLSLLFQTLAADPDDMPTRVNGKIMDASNTSEVGDPEFMSKALKLSRETSESGNSNLLALASEADAKVGGRKTVNISLVTLQDGTQFLVGSQSGGQVLAPPVREFMLEKGIIPLSKGFEGIHAEGNTINNVVVGLRVSPDASPLQSIVLAPSKLVCPGCGDNVEAFQQDSGIFVTYAPGVLQSDRTYVTGRDPWILP
jgi:hypothetical protein